MVAATLTSTTANGDFDLGVDGGSIAEGDVHARITFEVVGGGAARIQIGGSAINGDGVVSREPRTGEILIGETNVVEVDVVSRGDVSNPIPEPSGALLFVVGLIGVAAQRRGRR